MEVALLAGTVLLVLIVELLNSAMEATVDRISFDIHELSKRAKDYGSAAVLLSLVLCGGVWLGALWARFGIMTAPATFSLCVYCGSRHGTQANTPQPHA